MKLAAPKNANYAATVIRIRHINPLAGRDRVVGVPVFGYQAITSKADTNVGDLAIAFTAETQLSAEYASANNLFRHGHLNADPDQTGYLEDSGRVKAIKFAGHRSSALLMPLESLSYLGIDPSELKEGDTFDEIDGHEICRKYVVRQQRSRSELGVGQGRRRREPRVDEKLFPKHFDTPNYFKAPDSLGANDMVYVTQKLHGTSVRIGHTLVKRKLTLRDKVARFFGAKVQETEYAYVYGSRNVVKDPDNPFEPDTFYGSDIYTEVGSRLKGLLPKGTVVFGEIVGYVPNTTTPIQKGYTYGAPVGSAWLFVYRVATINEDGRMVDLSWPAVQEFCDSIGVEAVPELRRDKGISVDAGYIEYNFLDRRFASDGHLFALPTDDDRVDEGVCVRIDGIEPKILKAKSPKFLEFETKLLDEGVEDLESQNS